MIDSLGDFHFLRPYWLLLLPFAISIWWVWLKFNDPLRGWRSQMDPELVEALCDRRRPIRNSLYRWTLVAWCLAILSLAGPTWRTEPNPFADDASPLFVLLQVNAEMEKPPPQPSALQRGQLKIADLSELRSGQPLALFAYAGSAHLVLPPTRDTSVVAELAEQLRADVMPRPGDRLDLVIDKAAGLIRQSDSGGSILVITNSMKLEAAQMDSVREQLKGILIQVLAVVDEDSPEMIAIQETARSLGATVRPMTIETTDMEAIVRAASRFRSSGTTGEGARWEEAGYWLVPILAMLVAISFRRETDDTGELGP